jgi:hypothetical protein
LITGLGPEFNVLAPGNISFHRVEFRQWNMKVA